MPWLEMPFDAPCGEAISRVSRSETSCSHHRAAGVGLRFVVNLEHGKSKVRLKQVLRADGICDAEQSRCRTIVSGRADA
ncbi:MAG: hypothetical protein EG825_09450 [Rhodocyclaceae bacterium]|nr:hypothetical protein [Rhodocyclaceae bacterium]